MKLCLKTVLMVTFDWLEVVTRWRGRVEVCINRAWGTICDNGFGTEDAVVICNQLDVPYASKL